MKTSLVTFLCAGALAFHVSPIAAQQPVSSPAAADEEKYGVYPIAWRELVTRWLDKRLIDPASAVIDWTTEPKQVAMKSPDGQPLFGYEVFFRVNSRNKFGSYTGKQSHHVYIRNGEVAAGGRVTTK